MTVKKGFKMEQKKNKGGRKRLPEDKRKIRLQIYVRPKLAEKIIAYAEKISAEESE